MLLLGVAAYVFIGTVIAYVVGGFVTSQNDRDLVVWSALFWPVSTLVALVVLAFILLLVLLVGPIFVAANWQAGDLKTFLSDLRTVHLKNFLTSEAPCGRMISLEDTKMNTKMNSMVEVSIGRFTVLAQDKEAQALRNFVARVLKDDCLEEFFSLLEGGRVVVTDNRGSIGGFEVEVSDEAGDVCCTKGKTRAEALDKALDEVAEAVS